MNLLHKLLMAEAGAEEELGAGSGDENTETTNEIVEENVESSTADIDPEVEAFENLADSMLEDDVTDNIIDDEPLESDVVKGKAEKEDDADTAESPIEDKEKSDESDPAEEEESQIPQKEDEPKEEPKTLTAEEQEVKNTEDRQTSIDELIPMFALKEEDAELLKTDPGKAMPKLAAELFYDTHEAVVRSITQLFPTFLKQFNDAQEATKTQETSFFEQWPVLKDPKFSEDLTRVASVYRATNPTATNDQFIREVGAQLMVANKIPFDMETGKIVQTPEQITLVAHKPAIPSAAAQQSAKSNNEFEILAEEIDEFDRS